MWSDALKPGQVIMEDQGKMLWEVHGKLRIARGNMTRFRIEQKGEEFLLFEVLEKESVPVVRGSLEYCKGVAEGFEVACLLVSTLGQRTGLSPRSLFTIMGGLR